VIPERNGLVIPDGLSYDDWMRVGRAVVDVNRMATWAIGDWLVYGNDRFRKSHWGDREPSELYADISEKTGLAEQTLRNAATVCRRLPISRRRDHVTFSHAVEIVGRADPDEHEAWVDYVSQGGVSVRQLRDRLRRDHAEHAPERADAGTTSIFETTRQFARDYNAARSGMTPVMRVELRKILAPIFRDLA
jgi:hypothetical protein